MEFSLKSYINKNNMKCIVSVSVYLFQRVCLAFGEHIVPSSRRVRGATCGEKAFPCDGSVLKELLPSLFPRTDFREAPVSNN